MSDAPAKAETDAMRPSAAYRSLQTNRVGATGAEIRSPSEQHGAPSFKRPRIGDGGLSAVHFASPALPQRPPHRNDGRVRDSRKTPMTRAWRRICEFCAAHSIVVAAARSAK